MQKLAEDIDWHEQQIRLVRETLKAADLPSNPSREIEVATLSESVARLERTLEHLHRLQKLDG